VREQLEWKLVRNALGGRQHDSVGVFADAAKVAEFDGVAESRGETDGHGACEFVLGKRREGSRWRGRVCGRMSAQAASEIGDFAECRNAEGRDGEIAALDVFLGV